jgi:hypothetical protein
MTGLARVGQSSALSRPLRIERIGEWYYLTCDGFEIARFDEIRQA